MTDLARQDRTAPGAPNALVAAFNNPTIRGWFLQILAIAIIAYLVWAAYRNASAAASELGIFSWFRLWDGQAGFPIGFSLLDYADTDSIARAFVIGISNTLLVAALGIVLATILGFTIGLARLSPNWLLSRIAYWYVELFRNTPLLLILVFLYSFKNVLPEIGELADNPYGFYASVKGIYMPRPVFGAGAIYALAALILGVAVTIGLRIWSRARQARTGERFPLGWVALALIVGLPLLVFVASGWPLTFELAQKTRFNLSGGLEIPPEFLAVLSGLVLYTASFIAENVRAGVAAVAKGQTEAAFAVGLQRGQAMKLVVVPQAMRIIIPPMTNQYLNLTKNSTLATAIGYPEVINVGNSVLQKVPSTEVVLVWMGIFLFLSLLTSLIMNWYNRRVALEER
jgi:general L-amino acid transport system permease protein